MDLNFDEKRVLDRLTTANAPLTLRQLRAGGFPGVRPRERADSRVRNALRRLVRERLVSKVARGTYVRGGGAA